LVHDQLVLLTAGYLIVDAGLHVTNTPFLQHQLLSKDGAGQCRTCLMGMEAAVDILVRQ
jgi:hypothetical protein